MYLGLAIPFSAVADFFFYWRTDLIFSKEKLDLVSVEKITLKKKKKPTQIKLHESEAELPCVTTNW